MLKAVHVVYFCVITVNLMGLTGAKPIPGLQTPENAKVTTIKIPKAVISREEMVALAQYVMRMMASRINITLQPTTSHTDSPRFADNVQINSGAVQSTTPLNYHENLGNAKKTDYGLTRYADQKAQHPRGKVVPDPGVLDLGKTFINNGAPLTYEPFVRYAERNIEPFPNQFGFEIIPDSEASTTYIPLVEKGTGDLPLMEQVINNPLLPPASPSPITSGAGEEDLRSSNIRLKNLTIERVSSPQSGNSVMSVPFEAVITFTRQEPPSAKLEYEDQNIVVIPTRNPPDDFPPYFETILPMAKKTSDSSSGSLNSNPEKSLDSAGKAANEVVADNKHEVLQPMKKRQTPKVGELLGMLGLSTKHPKESRQGSAMGPTPSSPIVEPSRNLKLPKKDKLGARDHESWVTIRRGSKDHSVNIIGMAVTAPPQRGPMFQRQEIEEEEEEDGGSLGSITDLLPLVVPILEDLSDPNTETDIAEVLQAGLPLVQGISQGGGENDGVDLVGLVSPIFASLSGPNRNGNGTVFQAILPLVLPLVTPFIGPLIGPIIQGSSNPADQGGSSITPLIQALAGPLSLPTEPGGISIASSLISGIIASLSKDLKGGGNGGSDIGALVSTVVSGVLAGGSAGIKAKFTKPPSPAAHTGYAAYGQAGVPASSVDTLDLVGTSFKEILGLSLELVKSVITSVTGILGASSAEQPRPVYGPPNANFRIT